MHLNTTADKRFWVNEAPFLFLGEWCFLYPDKKENYAGSEVLKYPWDDRKLLLQNHSEVRVLYEVLLTKMVVLLNDLHGTHYSEKAWRIWIGPWLLWFLEVLFSRFLLIEKAVSSHKITSTITSSCELSYLAPRSYAHLNTDLWNSDVYNHLIFSEIIKSGFAGEIPYTEKVIDEPQPYSPSTDLALKRTKWPLNHSSLVFANSLLPRRDSYSLSLLLGKIPSVFSVETEPDITNTYSAAQRTLLKQALQVAIPMNPNPFERFIFTHLTNYIPKVYVEGFKEQLKYIDSTLSQHTPKVIVTGLGHLGNTSSIFLDRKTCE